MNDLTEIAEALHGTLQDELGYRGRHTIVDDVATFDLSGLRQDELATTLVEGLNASEDGEVCVFAFTTDTEGKEFITITKK